MLRSHVLFVPMALGAEKCSAPVFTTSLA